MSALFNSAPIDPGTNQLIIWPGSSPPTLVNAGVPYDAYNELAADFSNAVDHYHMGLPITTVGRLAVSLTPPDRIEDGVRPMAGDRLSVAESAIVKFNHGVPFTSVDSLAVIGVDSGGVRIISGPDNWAGNTGQTATFTVSVISGDASPLSYQWQEKVGSAWVNLSDGGRISGSSTITLSVINVVSADLGRLFRVKVTNSVNTRTSNSAALIVLDYSVTETYWVLTELAEQTITELGEEIVHEDAP